MKKIIQTFSVLPDSNKSMVYLMWIYGVWVIITTIFINIYIFQLNDSYVEVIIYNMLFYTSTFLWFSGVGWYMWYKQKDIKNMYYIGYVLFILSFVILFVFSQHTLGVYIFSVIYAFWNGAFWNAVHSQELKNIKDKNRDFYSSSISAGMNLIDVLVPLLIAVVFYVWDVFLFDGYTILFAILPLIYVLSFIFIHRIDSYIPDRVSYDDCKNFFNMKKYKFGHLYYFIWGVRNGLKAAVIWIVAIILLETEMNVWFFQWILALMSMFVVMHFSLKRHTENRLHYLATLSVLLFINFLIFSLYFSVIFFLIFSFVLIFLESLYRVSEHTYDLSLMDNVKTPTSDFYPSMLLRELVLYMGRILILILLLLLFLYTWIGIENILRVWIFFMWLSYLFIVVSIYYWEKHEKHS